MRRNDTQTMGFPRIGRGSQSGFSLVEMLVTLTILVLILVAVLTAFDLNTKIARTQIHVSDMQQSLRVAQNQLVKTIRMTGRGGVPVGGIPDTTLSLEIDNKIAASTELVTGESDTEIVPDTDVLTVRGVFDGNLYQANPATSLTLNLSGACNPGPGNFGQVVLNDPSPSGVPQDFTPLTSLAPNDALLLMSPIDSSIYAVVEIKNVDVTVPNQATICFQITGSPFYTAEYLALSGGAFNPALTTVSYVGVVEEYRYYIRKVHAAGPTSDLTPTLAVARFYPGTQIAYNTDPATYLYVDLADNIMDLQLAFGVDLDNDGVVTENAPGSKDTDEWLFNDAGDDPNPTLWVGNLFYVRVSGLARTDRRDLDFISEPITAIEDRDYSEPAVPATQPELEERAFRRWQLQTLVDLRNVS